MKLHADLSERAVVDSEALAWVDSPLPGVQRRMLERDGEEVARATSIVRYARDSRFSAHTHGGGEEFLVLDGVFSDESGDFAEGTYVRNPPGSRHTPRSGPGCTILVKLHQMADDDQVSLRIDTTTTPWQAGPAAGVEMMPLHAHGAERVQLVRLAPGSRLGAPSQPGGQEIFVLEGQLDDDHACHGPGTWLRDPVGAGHRSALGCVLYVKTGHLTAAARAAGGRDQDRAS